MFGIRKVNYPTLILCRCDPRSIDPGPSISGLSYNTRVFNTLDEAEKEINQIYKWYKRYHLTLDNKFESFELSNEDKHEMTVTALKWKK
jgi:hypothetical protein